MAQTSRRGGSDATYFFRFAGTAALLVSGTLVLVLVVLPQRYVLSSGFREGSLALPDPSVPFVPTDPLLVSALPAPAPPEAIPQGPAEIFWSEVGPLLEREQYLRAIPLFTGYLAEHPGDLDVRREYALTLIAEGLPERAVPVLESLVEAGNDRDLQLILARMLRDQRRMEEASVHYRALLEGSPDDEALVLEWARALAWVEDYSAAERVLTTALERDPTSVPLRVELARVYYYTDRLEEAETLLSGLTDAELASADGSELYRDILVALAPIPGPEAPPPTSLELAVGAREDGDFERAAELFAVAIAENPSDIEAWQAYADFLQFAVEDFPGALEALREVERLRDGGDVALQYRMAQLEIWTDRLDEAEARLERLIPMIDDGPAPEATGDPTVTRADVYALLGDLDRWHGNRRGAVDDYELALAEDPQHPAALAGVASIRAEVDRTIRETEQPGVGGVARSLADTDDYRRVDLGGQWRGLNDDWVWGTTAGVRWLEGYDLTQAVDSRTGLFVDLEGGRWWRWGTVRTVVRIGAQEVRSSSADLSAGASVRFAGEAGHRTDISFDHEPAFGVTNTLQSVVANVTQDRLAVSHSQPLGEEWSLSATAEAASLDHDGFAGSDRNLRLQGGLSVGRILSRELTIGVATRGASFRDEAPGPVQRRLYWDPNSTITIGPYAQLTRPLGGRWELQSSVNPGVGYIDERGTSGGETVPDISAHLALIHDDSRYRSMLELFFGQGRFSGYRSYGLNFTFSARSGFGGGSS